MQEFSLRGAVDALVVFCLWPVEQSKLQLPERRSRLIRSMLHVKMGRGRRRCSKPSHVSTWYVCCPLEDALRALP